MASANSSSPPLLSAVKGLAVAASFISTGSLTALSAASLPGIIASTKDDSTSAQTAAQQFALAVRVLRTSQLPLELVSTAAYAFLAYTYHASSRPLGWKLFAGAAVAMSSVVPYTLAFMEQSSQKLVQLAGAPPHTASTQPSMEHSGETGNKGMLAPPGQSDMVRDAMTPAEEFEPYEDSPFSTDEYERMKVQKMLKVWNSRNGVRVLGPLLAGVLGMWGLLEG